MSDRTRQILNILKRYGLISLGCMILAFGDAAFITPLGLVTGGVLSVGVIVQHFFTAAGLAFNVVDIVLWITQIILLIVSFIVLGKRFTARSLFATLFYPLIFSLFYRVPMVNGMSLGNYIGANFIADPTDWGLVILASLGGGTLIGIGVALSYHGGGSTGGLDVISVILAKYTPIKEAVSALLMDGTLVIIGMIVMHNVVLGLIGVLGALACALAVQYIYVNTEAFIIADIISSEYEKIRKYVETKMDRTTTVFQVVGGYTGEERKMLRVAFSRRELYPFRAFIGDVDPRAFVTFTKATTINGEGFDPLVRSSRLKKKKFDSDSPDLHGKP